MRCAKRVNDIVEKIQTDLAVENLKQLFIQKFTGEELTLEHVRFFHGGKEMKNLNLVGEYGLQDDTVITVFIVKQQKPVGKSK